MSKPVYFRCVWGGAHVSSFIRSPTLLFSRFDRQVKLDEPGTVGCAQSSFEKGLHWSYNQLTGFLFMSRFCVAQLVLVGGILGKPCS